MQGLEDFFQAQENFMPQEQTLIEIKKKHNKSSIIPSPASTSYLTQKPRVLQANDNGNSKALMRSLILA